MKTSGFQKTILKESSATFDEENSFWHETPKRTFRVKSTCTSFHQNELYLQAMIGSLPLALFEIVSCVLQPFSSCFSFNPLFSRTLSTSRPKWSRSASTASIGGNHVVIANDLLSWLIAYTIVSWIT